MEKSKQTPSKIFFVGIGGASMSALAILAKRFGAIVDGCDDNSGPYIKILEKEGIYPSIPPNEARIEGFDVVVFSSAIKSNHIMLRAAKKFGIKTISRAKFLSVVESQFNYSIAVSGSHGKSTTTALLCKMLKENNFEFGAHIGAIVAETQTNFAFCGTKYFVCEACEYKNNFRHLTPSLAIVLNIDFDHPDCFKNYSSCQKVFRQFASQSACLLCHESCSKVLHHKNKHTFGFSDDCEFKAKNIVKTAQETTFDVFKNQTYLQTLSVSSTAECDVINALCAFSASVLCGAKHHLSAKALSKFSGLGRRFENIKTNLKTTIISDYAHHPTELRSTIARFLCLPQKNKLIVFQPHTYSRTKCLFEDFAHALNVPKNVELALFSTYPAREEFDKEGDAKTLQQRIKLMRPCLFLKTLDDAKNKIKEFSASNSDSAILIVGAGNLDDVRHML